jgi:hypothetical protein
LKIVFPLFLPHPSPSLAVVMRRYLGVIICYLMLHGVTLHL